MRAMLSRVTAPRRSINYYYIHGQVAEREGPRVLGMNILQQLHLQYINYSC